MRHYLAITIVVLLCCIDYSYVFAECPFKNVNDCVSTSPFRTVNGACNNLKTPWWGKSEIPYKRYLNADYSDGRQLPRKFGKSGKELPNPRLISRTLFVDNGQTEVLYSHILASFGQFIAHDITSVAISTDNRGAVVDCSCGSTNPSCMSIIIPEGDSLMKSSCIKFTRSSAAFPSFDCKLDEREQLNLISSFIDGSQIYGIDAIRSQQLRSLVGGQLKSSPGVNKRPLVMQGIDGACRDTSATVKCFICGEGRANENLGLTALQTLFLRGHNSIAQDLAKVNPSWNDERLYQETRRIVIGILQHIVYNEFLPTVIGSSIASMFDLTPLNTGFFDGYDETINPTIANEFSTAAFRFGHTLVRNTFSRSSPNNQKTGEIGLDKIVFRPVEAYNGNAGGIDSILIGLLNDAAAKFDTNFVDTLQNHLFEFKLPDGSAIAIDLAATNINRGRDHGIPSYNAYRDRCGLKHAETFQDFADSIDAAQVQKLSELYESPDDVDLYVGGLSERPSEGAVIGPIFACIVASQFKDLKKGDRFYFENGPNNGPSLSLDQLNEIRKMSLSRFICDNTDVIQIQPNSFLLPSSQNNARIPCKSIPQMNLNAWASKN